MEFEKIKKYENEHIMQNFARYDVCFSNGEGIKLYDINGKEYLDFFAGIATNLLGHNDKELVSAIVKQAKKGIHFSNHFYNETVSKYAKKLTAATGFVRVFLSNSGAEANECAIKAARKHFKNLGLEKYKFISLNGSFHGRTLTTATLTGQPKYSEPFAPLPEGFIHVERNNFSALKRAADKNTAAIFLELVQGESGVIPADLQFVKNVAKLCKRKNILLIIDEIQTGMGRCGKLLCSEIYGIRPDIVTLGKGIAGGIPMGATLFNRKTQNSLSLFEHGTTFGGNPFACAAAALVLKKVNNEEFLSSVQAIGEYFSKKLREIKDKFDLIIEHRGVGLLQALQLDEKIKGREIVKKMLDKGFVINCTGKNSLRFCPPLIVKKEDIDLLCIALTDCLKSATK